MKQIATQLEPSYLEIKGGRQLTGTVKPDGAKNSALIQIAALALVEDNFVTLSNVPGISDVADEVEMLREVGFNVKYEGDEISINGKLSGHEFSYEYGSKIRASLAFLGSVLPKQKKIKLPLPGGDKIGPRPIDIHIDVMRAFGIETDVRDGFIYAEAKTYPLQGATAYLRYPSVLATVNGILLGVHAKGRTVLQNVAKEPEIVDLTNLLSKMGADIRGVGTDKITIEGVDSLKTTYHDIMPDRLEAAALVMSFVMSGGYGTVERTIPEHNGPLIDILRHTGVEIDVEGDKIHVNAVKCKRGFHAEARPFPALATDVAPILTPLALKCPGISKITDTVHPERFAHVDELIKLGADIDRVDNSAYINGDVAIRGGSVSGGDIRTVVSLINAALSVDDTFAVYGIEHLNRGHAHFIEKLNALGANIHLR